MAFKPYRRTERDIYKKYDKPKLSPNSSGAVKLFGFRSGISYKMIPALLYYSFFLFYIAVGIYGEVRYYSFEPIDVVLEILKYIFYFIMFFSPAIFLSDFKYRDNLPFFKKRDAGSSIIGMILVWMFCSFMIFVYKECLSDTYWNSVSRYEQYLKEERAKKQGTTEETTTIKSGNMEIDLDNNKIYIGGTL